MEFSHSPNRLSHLRQSHQVQSPRNTVKGQEMAEACPVSLTMRPIFCQGSRRSDLQAPEADDLVSKFPPSRPDLQEPRNLVCLVHHKTPGAQNSAWHQ